MLDVRRILCPVDFSDASRHAFAHAVVIGGWYGASITVLHVASPVVLPEQPIVFAGFPTVAVAPEDRPTLETRLRDWLELPAGRQTADIIIEDGYNASAHILERAASWPADLLVMGTHGRSGFDRVVLGSVTEKVLRKASCPVLTVPPPAVRVAKLPYKRVLCPIDFSPSSIAAFRFACSIAKESDAHLTLMHVFDSPVDSDWPVQQFDSPEFRAQREAEARHRLDALIADDVRTWAEPATHVSFGKPYRRILAVAEKDEVDLLVMGVHGRNPLDMLLMGSTTNQVVRRASCPVLTLKQ
jgi:nucleotide-binding universal stress UspA family protein